MRRRENVINKTDLQMQNSVDKNNLQDTEGSTEIISSSTATACNSKIIDIDMDLRASLSFSVTALTSEYQLIDMSILTDIFMLLSCLGCHGTPCLKLCDLMKKRKVWQDICNSVALLVDTVTHFSPRNKTKIDLPKKNKGGQKLYYVNVRAIYGCKQDGTSHYNSFYGDFESVNE